MLAVQIAAGLCEAASRLLKEAEVEDVPEAKETAAAVRRTIDSFKMR